MSEWWSLLPVACLALGFGAGWLLRGSQRVSFVPPVQTEDADDKKKPEDIVNRRFFT